MCRWRSAGNGNLRRNRVVPDDALERMAAKLDAGAGSGRGVHAPRIYCGELADLLVFFHFAIADVDHTMKACSAISFSCVTSTMVLPCW